MLSGRDIRRLMGAGARDALEEAAEQIRAAAAAAAPPTDVADDPDPSVSLARSGRVEMSADGRTAKVIFDAPYAAKQHEAQHFQHPRGGKSKYLEDALKAELPRLEGIVAGKVRARVGRGR